MRSSQRAAPHIDRGIQRDGFLARHLEIELQVILEIFPDTGQIVHHIDTVRAQFRGGSHPGELQQLGRVDGSAAENQLFTLDPMRRPCVRVLERARTPALEHDAGRERMGEHFEVRPAHRRAQVGVGGAAASAAAHGHVHATEAFLLEAVDVGGLRIARLAGGGQPRGVQRIFQRAIAGLQLAVRTAIVVAAFLALLGAPKIRQHVAVGPAGRTLFLPALEIVGIAADVHQAVDRRGPAQYLAARRVHAAPIQVRLRLRVIEPVVLRHVHRYRQRRGHLDENGSVRAAVFEQQHPPRPVGAQPVRQYASRGSRADDHRIETVIRHDLSSKVGRSSGVAQPPRQYGASMSPMAT